MPLHEGWRGDPSKHASAALKGWSTRRRNAAIGAGVSPEQADFNAWYYGVHNPADPKGPFLNTKDPRRVAAGKKSAKTRADRVIKAPKADVRAYNAGPSRRANRDAARAAALSNARITNPDAGRNVSGASMRRSAERRARAAFDAQMYGTQKQQARSKKQNISTRNPRRGLHDQGVASAGVLSSEFGADATASRKKRMRTHP